VIAEACSSWLRQGLVDKVRSAYPIPVTHVVSREPIVDLAGAPLKRREFPSRRRNYRWRSACS
jgi:hypothetical protein